MKTVTVVGMGLSAATITPEARDAIDGAQMLLGAPRLLAMCAAEGKRTHSCYLAEDVAAVVGREDAVRFAVLVSGDVGFYSAAAGLGAALKNCELRYVPGISTVSAFFARLGMPWQDAALLSAHGRDANIVDAVRRNRLTFCLTGGNVPALGGALAGAGLGGIPAHVGENLGGQGERVYSTTAGGLREGAFPPLTALLFVNERYDARTPTGLPDGRFARMEGIPMTKSEVRAIVLSRLALCPCDTVWDVGAGTGSVSVEMALSAHSGHVYAVERKADAVGLIRENAASFHIGNLTALCGKAPEALEDLPAPNAAFIGGGGAAVPEIVAAILRKNPAARIVLTAVTIETVSAALCALNGAGLEPEIVQISATRARLVGGLHMMEAQNPVTVLCAGGTR